jgi:hypothetical protein
LGPDDCTPSDGEQRLKKQIQYCRLEERPTTSVISSRCTNFVKNRSQDSSEGSDFESLQGQDFFLSKQVLGPTHLPIQWVPGAVSAGVKQLGREDDSSHPTSAEVKNMWIYTSTPLYVFME